MIQPADGKKPHTIKQNQKKERVGDEFNGKNKIVDLLSPKYDSVSCLRTLAVSSQEMTSETALVLSPPTVVIV